MAKAGARAQRVAERRQQILDAARAMAESDGWAAVGGKTGPQAVAAVADVYLSFAATHPSLYEAMFQLPIDARFAQDNAETELRSGFNALAGCAKSTGPTG